MDVVGVVRNFVTGGVKLSRIEFDKMYLRNFYKSAVKRINNYSSVNGVKELVDTLNREYDNYFQELDEYTKPEREKENNKYLIWRKIYLAKNVCKIAFIILTILSYIVSFNIFGKIFFWCNNTSYLFS